MRLGDWYWNQGAQKTRESFRQLLDIIGDPAFSPSTVSETAWSAVDEELGWNLFDGDIPEWLGHDKGWKCLSATISVPFHSQCSKPGLTSYTVDGFYHHSLVSIIKEKIENPAHATFFHFEPYELRWCPPHRQHDVKVYGELFSSTAFVKANKVLQASPGEPGCDLPRVVVALMFWSDATKLTAFGDAKLWPLYVFFGNKSKYRRSQPTNGLCSHAAYFQSVKCSIFWSNLCVNSSPSYQTNSRIFWQSTWATRPPLVYFLPTASENSSTNSGGYSLMKSFWRPISMGSLYPVVTQVPSFGRDTICRFSTNMSEMRRMAAHDFEDILQVPNSSVNGFN